MSRRNRRRQFGCDRRRPDWDPRGFLDFIQFDSDSDSDIELSFPYDKPHSRSFGSDTNILKTEDGIDVNTVYASFKDVYYMKKEDVQGLFKQFGEVKSVRLHENVQRKPERTKKSFSRRQGAGEGNVEHTHIYGFISFKTCEDAARCLRNKSKLNNICFIAKADSWHQDAYQEKLQMDMGHDKKQGKKKACRLNGCTSSFNGEENEEAGPSACSSTANTSENCDSEKCSNTNIDASSVESGKDNLAEEAGRTSMNILQMNDDCLMLIFGQLDLMDLISLEKTCDRFGSIVNDIYKRYKKFDFDDELQNKAYLTMLDAKTVLTEVGSFMRSLSISQNRFLQPGLRVLKLIPRFCLNLTELEIRDFTLNPITIQSLESVFKNLEALSLVCCGISDNIETSLSRAKNLHRLDLSLNSEIIGNCLKGIGNLKYLNLDSCQNIQGKPFAAFAAKNKTLEYLNINCCSRLTVDAIKSIVNNMTELSHLVCNNCYDNVDPASMALLAKLPKLTKIQFKFNSYSPIDQILKDLVESDKLEHLDLSDGIFTTVDYNLLCGLTRLTELKLNYKLDFTDQHLSKLAAKGNFVELHIAGCTSVRDKQLLEFIKMNPRLKLLDISYCQISEGLIFSAIDILKEQAVLRDASLSRKLKMMVGQTSICPVINENNLIQNNRHLLEISFDYTEGFYGELDADDMYDDVDEDDEDFMGYDNEEHLWGLDYDSELDMYQQFYDSDDDVSRFLFFG
ncbi:uncharacterized protein LOC128734897 [Sabethes cyaneus]|uniref:uncharacterized protein LOC128734897 n=1 Tax=Sabethes cyaneus TaxID=53552 RepID=UPI00237E71D4|nr:uncharacterized protein LOC128734897 [Sabethes cyaneus]